MSKETMHKLVSDIVSPVYLVGGSVRDGILGKEPKDYDFTTPLSPDEVEAKAKAAGRHVYTIGKKFGTIGFKVQEESGAFQYVEVTTFRRETYEAGNRKPEVEFVTDLKDDLSRRDFTINAIAFDGEKYIDPFGGRLDIMVKKIKAVGDAKDRFREDPLRMLRAARFAAQLGFEVDPNLIGKARAMAHTISTVSRERWVQEIDKLLVAPRSWEGIELLINMHLLKYMLPEVSLLKNDSNVWNATMINFLAEKPDADLRWARLIEYTGIPATRIVKKDKSTQPYYEKASIEIAKGICARLKFSNDRTNIILETIAQKRLTK